MAVNGGHMESCKPVASRQPSLGLELSGARAAERRSVPSTFPAPSSRNSRSPGTVAPRAESLSSNPLVRLYGLSFSHPSIAARLMLERAAIEHRWVTLPGGVHPLYLRAKGFGGSTVPALDWDGRRVQGSLEISRTIEAHGPPGVLFPVETDARRRVEEAEAWGERELQPVPRRLFRWALWRHGWLRKTLAERGGMPWPAVTSALMRPLAARFARISGADDATVLADRERLPRLIDRVDALIAEGTIGDPERPNAADFQIGTSVRSMIAFEDLRPLIAGGPAEAHALAILPKFPGPVPPVLPPRRQPA